MPKPSRFTGQNPPPGIWQQYPNWRNAYEEEGEEGQDESTLMPDEVQTHIGKHTSFTAGKVHLHDGREFPAFLAIGQNGITGCYVYETDIPWRIYYAYPQKKWVSFQAEWLPESARPPQVSFHDNAVFPLEIRMQLSWREGEIPVTYRITADGQMHKKR